MANTRISRKEQYWLLLDKSPFRSLSTEISLYLGLSKLNNENCHFVTITGIPWAFCKPFMLPFWLSVQINQISIFLVEIKLSKILWVREKS